MDDARDALERQNAFYETMREDLEANSFGGWAVVSNCELVGVYGSNREASEVALRLTPDQACLVKHIGHVVEVSQQMAHVNRVPVGNS